MSFSLSTPFFCILSFTFLLQIVTGTIPVLQHCPRESAGHPSSHSFKLNLKSVLKNLSSPEAALNGFSLSSAGEGDNKVNGLALCQGDLNPKACQACLTEATSKIKQCSNQLHAIIWYDSCFVKFAKNDFFGEVDYFNQFSICNQKSAGNETSFDAEVGNALDKIKEEASVKPKMYAAAKFIKNYRVSDVIYVLAQCTRDLSEDDCKSCLGLEIAKVQGFCSGKVGGRGIGGSCNVRYEIYPFFNA